MVKHKDDSFINNRINAKEVLVIGPNGEQLGIKTKEDALILANAAGFDLVAVNMNSTPPVCKLLDYNKYRYEKSKKAKEMNKKQTQNISKLKEFRLSVNIDKHDFDTRLKNVIKHVTKGNKIKVTIRFKGREMAHTDMGHDVLLRFAEQLKDVAEIEQEPKLDGRTMIMFLVPKKDK
ncbi:MAG: translation initiation factor IF-3 [Bacilli bacterium]|nr:translation initiation factor IF-3 [Bacilli bacterium]